MRYSSHLRKGYLIYSREAPEGPTSLTFSNPRLKRNYSNSWGSRITSELMCRMIALGKYQRTGKLHWRAPSLSSFVNQQSRTARNSTSWRTPSYLSSKLTLPTTVSVIAFTW